MEVGGSDRLQTPINHGHLKGQSSLPLVVPTANTVMSRHEGGGGSHESDENEKNYNFKDFEFLLHIANFKGWETSHIGLRASRKSMKKKIPESPDVVRRMKNILS